MDEDSLSSEDDEYDWANLAERRVLTQWFSGGEAPLARCLAWTRRQLAGTGQRFIVLAHQVPVASTGRVVREYQAIDAGQGLAIWAATPMAERCAEEVIGEGPVNVYADLDVSVHDPAYGTAQLLCDQLIAGVCAAVRQQFGLECRMVQLDSSSPRKFSRHLIGHLHEPGTGRRAALPGSRACGAFMTSVQQQLGLTACLATHTGHAQPLCDPAVYHRLGNFRTYGSTKQGQNRWLRVRNAGDGTLVPLPANGTLDLATLRDTLVNVPPEDNPIVLAYGPTDKPTVATSSPHWSMAMSQRTRMRMTASAGSSRPQPCSPAQYDALLAECAMYLPTVYAAEVHSIDMLPPSGTTLMLKCRSRNCATKGALHTSNTIYFLLDTQRQRYQQRCWAPACKSRKPGPAWHALPPPVARAAANAIGHQPTRSLQTPPLRFSSLTAPMKLTSGGSMQRSLSASGGFETTILWPE